MSRRALTHKSQVINLSGVRARLRLTANEDKLNRALDANEQALRMLYGTGFMFNRSGTRVGRDLLLSRQYLLKTAALLRRLADEGEVPAPRVPKRIESVYQEVNELLERSALLVERVAPFFEQLPRPSR